MTGKILLTLVLLLIGTHAMALVEVGDVVPLLKWQDINEKMIASEDYKGSIQVLLYNGGFCPGCKEEFADLIPEVHKYNGKAIQFISLSVAGWSSQSKPDTKFLKEWQQQYKIPFVVAASTRLEGKNFFEIPYIPSVVIVSAKGKLLYKAIEPGVIRLLKEVDKALAEEI